MEKKIVLTMDDDLNIEYQGFDNALEVIGTLRLVEAQLIESINGALIRTEKIRES